MDILSTPDLESPPERWAPVGAVAESPDTPPTEPLSSNSTGTVDALLEENEKMASSLLSLTSHFAQVQFRLKQIVEGPEETKAERLKELEAFAEKGIPDIKSCVVPRLPDSCESAEDQSDEEYKRKLSYKQREMIADLKSSLTDLESYAYENGLAEELPTSEKLAKQDVIIQEIKKKLQISHLDNIASLSSTELRECVDEAIAQIVHPAKVKEKQVEQLQTQVVDLERFVGFLQTEVSNAQKETKLKASNSSKSSTRMRPAHRPPILTIHRDAVRTPGTGSSYVKDEEYQDESFTARMKRILSVIHLYILSELGCRSRISDNNREQMSTKDNKKDYDGMLAELRASVDLLSATAEKVAKEKVDSTFTDCDYLSEEETYISESRELTKCVRKQFTPTLKKILEHGLTDFRSSQALMSIAGRTPNAAMITSVTDNKMRAWRVILQYYEIKGGPAYNEAPHRKLANSFGIDSMSNSEASIKHSLLTAIGQILETHRLYRRGDEAHFKAFICLALNEKKLVAWLRQIFRTPAIAEQYYEPWGYLVKTGFEDIFCVLNKLKQYDFNLPVDLAVQQFSNIKDAF